MFGIGTAGENIDVVIRPAGLARVECRGRQHGARPTAAATNLGLAAQLGARKRHPHIVNHRVLHRHLQPPAFAGAVALVQGGEDADRHQHAGAGVAERGAWFDRRTVAISGDANRAAGGLGDHVEGEVLLVRAALAETLDLAVDDPRVQLLDDVVAEPGERLGAGWTRLELGKVHDSDAFETVQLHAHSIHRSSLLPKRCATIARETAPGEPAGLLMAGVYRFGPRCRVAKTVGWVGAWVVLYFLGRTALCGRPWLAVLTPLNCHSGTISIRTSAPRAGAELSFEELALPDLDQIKQGEQGVRDRRGRFARVRSGNPAGRPRGCRDHLNRAARLQLAGGGEALTAKPSNSHSPATPRCCRWLPSTAGCRTPERCSASPWAEHEGRWTPVLAVLVVVLCGRVAFEGFLQALWVDADFDAGALLLEDHWGTRVALAPAAIQRFGELGKGEVGDAHRHVEIAAQLGGKRHILVRQPQGEGGGLVFAGEELVDQPVKGAPPAAGAVAHGFP